MRNGHLKIYYDNSNVLSGPQVERMVAVCITWPTFAWFFLLLPNPPPNIRSIFQLFIVKLFPKCAGGTRRISYDMFLNYSASTHQLGQICNNYTFICVYEIIFYGVGLFSPSELNILTALLLVSLNIYWFYYLLFSPCPVTSMFPLQLKDPCSYGNNVSKAAIRERKQWSNLKGDWGVGGVGVGS